LLAPFKDKGNPVPLKVIQQIRREDRLPALAKKYGEAIVGAVLSKAIQKALSNFNLRVGMTAEQVVDLAYMLIESAEEDQLALEDILLFLDGLVKNKYGKVYDRMDIPTFFELLEKYREERHKAYMDFKEEIESQHKAMGDSNRTSELLDQTEKNKHRTAMNVYNLSKKS